MTTTWPLRLAAACGLLYPVTLYVGDDAIGRGDRIAPDAGTPAEVAANVAAAGDTFFYGRALGLTSTLMLLVFAAYAAMRLRQTGPDSLWPPLALGAGTIAATLQLTAAVPQLAVAGRDDHGAEPELLVTLLELGAPFVLSMLPLALLVAAIAYGTLNGADTLVGRGVAWTGAVLAPAMVAGFLLFIGGLELGFLPLPLSWLWFIAAGVSAVRRVDRQHEWEKYVLA